MRTVTRILLAAFLLFVTGNVLFSHVVPVDATDRPRPTTNEESDASTGQGSYLILSDMPPDATLADYGAEIYRLVCRDCHGDRGQGLTNEWRATWDPSDQNCWQSKCHAATHPIEGFELPRTIPAIIGPETLVTFDNALELYEFVSQKMPYHNPGSLLESEYWQVTAYLLEQNQPSTVIAQLDKENASSTPIHTSGTAVAFLYEDAADEVPALSPELDWQSDLTNPMIERIGECRLAA